MGAKRRRRILTLGGGVDPTAPLPCYPPFSPVNATSAHTHTTLSPLLSFSAGTLKNNRDVDRHRLSPSFGFLARARGGDGRERLVPPGEP